MTETYKITSNDDKLIIWKFLKYGLYTSLNLKRLVIFDKLYFTDCFPVKKNNNKINK